MADSDLLVLKLPKLDSMLGKLNLFHGIVQINLALLMQKVCSNNGAPVLPLKLSQKTKSALKFLANFGQHIPAYQTGS